MVQLRSCVRSPAPSSMNLPLSCVSKNAHVRKCQHMCWHAGVEPPQHAQQEDEDAPVQTMAAIRQTSRRDSWAVDSALDDILADTARQSSTLAGAAHQSSMLQPVDDTTAVDGALDAVLADAVDQTTPQRFVDEPSAVHSVVQETVITSQQPAPDAAIVPALDSHPLRQSETEGNSLVDVLLQAREQERVTQAGTGQVLRQGSGSVDLAVDNMLEEAVAHDGALSDDSSQGM